MAEHVSIQKYDFPPQVGKPPQCAARVLVPPIAKGNEGEVWSATGAFDPSAVDSGTPSRGGSFNFRRPPVSLQWHNITLTTCNGKPILKGVSGSANNGELMVIMGPSVPENLLSSTFCLDSRVLSYPDFINVTEAEFFQKLSDRNVCAARRINILHDGRLIPTQHAVLTFEIPVLSKSVKADTSIEKLSHIFPILFGVSNTRGMGTPNSYVGVLSLFVWNCRGFRTKACHIKDLINELNPVCIAFQETYLKPADIARIKRDSLVRKDNETKSGRASGGVALLVFHNTPSSVITLNTNLQALAVRVMLSNLITVFTLYLPLITSVDERDLDRLVDELPAPFIIIMDFNGHSPCGAVRIEILVDVKLRSSLILTSFAFLTMEKIPTSDNEVEI
ncbi:hypothetical protein AVEN_256650-1 [Araneus ventricosus]|uniref:Endonuclease/exonuclease/phosphatase domain-containing protein n=1 Tax=Araneus ventricosus TaxID=182803 RepID=A0A4Y2NE45_ARAVE|nr:hypothetical protein AVEN_256650-1 [Araneus ventricosus]